MTHDPDLLAIQRKRRQEGRCLRCAVRTPRAALCPAYRAEWRYCPRCERVYPRTEARTPNGTQGRATEYCRPCGTRLRSGERAPRAVWLAQSNAARDARFAVALRLFRRGLSYAEVGRRMGLSKGAVSGLAAYARACGKWPLARKRAA